MIEAQNLRYVLNIILQAAVLQGFFNQRVLAGVTVGALKRN